MLYSFSGNGILQFILTHLKIPTQRNIIRWTNKAKKKFQIVDPQKFALMWGKEKNKQSMTMGKLRRSLNYQVHIGKLKRISKNHYYINVSQKEETPTKIANDCHPETYYVNEKEKYRNSYESENSRYRQSIEEKDVTSGHQSINNQVTDNDFLQSIINIKNVLSESPTTIPREVDSENNEKVEVTFTEPIFDNKESNPVINATENISSKINIGESNNIQSLASSSRDISELPLNICAESELKYYVENQKHTDNYMLMNTKKIRYPESIYNNALEGTSKFYQNNPNADSSNAAAFKTSSVIQNHIDQTAGVPLVIPFYGFDLYLQDFEEMN